MAIQIVQENKPYRLISDGRGQFAVIEARAGHVYSLHGRNRLGAEDTPEGMAAVVGDGWRDEDSARRRFADMCDRRESYSRIIW